MRHDQEIAVKLRRAGKSYKEISLALNIPKSTLSNWFASNLWSQKTKQYLSDLARENASIRMKALSSKRKVGLQKIYKNQGLKAQQQFKKYIKERLFLAGLTLYWGEGDNKLANGMIRVSNSDPKMIRLYYKFLQAYLPEICYKARIYLVLYRDLAEQECRTYWSKIVGLPVDRFFRSSYIKGKHPTKRLAHGIGTLTISNREYKEKIIAWVNMLKETEIS
ncbi:MAG: hypothetical protein WC453_04080 [Patescibacteria group bacterium]